VTQSDHITISLPGMVTAMAPSRHSRDLSPRGGGKNDPHF